MTRVFVAVVLLNVFGAVWWMTPPNEVTASAAALAPTAEIAMDVAWDRAEARLDPRCEVDHLVGIEEIEEVSNGYRAQVHVSGRCG